MRDLIGLLKTEYIEPAHLPAICVLLRKMQEHCFEMVIHSIDVSNICLQLVSELNKQGVKMTKKQISELYMGALMHDVGKLDVPSELLTKKDATLEERQYIQLHHIQQTKVILEKYKFPDNVINIAYHHHERIDGSGYELHLQGEQLSLPDRILQVADCTGSMLMDRAYRKSGKGLGPEITKTELAKMPLDDNLKEMAINLIEKHYPLVQSRYEDVKQHYIPLECTIK